MGVNGAALIKVRHFFESRPYYYYYYYYYYCYYHCTLIDLKSAFGEAHHSLIQSVLRYHYIPDEINCIVKICIVTLVYRKLRATFIPNTLLKNRVFFKAIRFPLIFNLIITTFIQCVKEEKFTNFSYRTFKCFLPRNWFQFAGDAVAVTSLEGENQILLNSSANGVDGQK